MKKIAIILALLMLLSSCSAGEAEESTNTPETVAPVTETALTETEAVTETETGTETTAAPETEPPVHVESVSLDRADVTLTVGASEMPVVTMLPENAEDKSEVWSSDNEAVATVNYYGLITAVGAGECTVSVTSADNTQATASVSVRVTLPETEPPAPAPAPKPAPAQPSDPAEPTYFDGVLIVNKTYRLPSTYNPGVDPTARAALDGMFDAASREGIFFWIVSDFRSYEFQKEVYGNYSYENGSELADTFSARPGHSEHQTGLAFDLNSCYQSFGDTAEGRWLAENCHKYGFIIRYPAGKESVTGFIYEPWHVRYLGVDMAKKVHDSGLCLEEYFNITSQYDN